MNREVYKPLHLVCKASVALELIEAGEDVNKRLSDGFTPLLMCWQDRDSSIIQVLLNHGAEVNARSHKGFALVDYVDKPELIVLLAEYGSDLPDELWCEVARRMFAAQILMNVECF